MTRWTSSTRLGRSISPTDRLTLQNSFPAQRMAVQPFGQLPRRLGHHHQAQIVHQAHLVGQAQELVRRHQAALGVTPAGQGLEAGDGAGVQVHDRLEEGFDLAAHEGVAQVGLQRQTAEAVAFQRAAVGGGSAASGALGLTHGQFDPAQQFGRIGRIGAALAGDRADRDGRIDVEAGDAQRLFQRLAHPFAGVGDAALQDDGELVLADPRRGGLFRKRPGQPRAERRQHQIGALVAQRLVQPPQPVDVGDDQIIVAGHGQNVGGPGQKGAAVQQTGQGILVGARELRLQRHHPRGAQPSSSQTPRHRQVSDPRMRRRTAISEPSSRGVRMLSASDRSCGRVTATKAAPEHSGASGPRPSGRVAPVKRRASSEGVQIHRAVSAAARASIAVVASQASVRDREGVTGVGFFLQTDLKSARSASSDKRPNRR
jgi:hypothetical protein